VTTQDALLEQRLEPEVGARRVTNYLKTLTMELTTIARACGKPDVHHLEREDLVALTVEAPPLALQVRVEGQRLLVGPVETDQPADLGVRATLGGLISQLPMFRRDDAPPVGRMRLEGDADLARRLQRLAERFDPDWQQPFARVFGDVLGVQIANAFAGALKQARVAGRNLAESAAEFVTEESRDVVARAELNAFHDDVDVLRDDVERMAARVARLAGPGQHA
jgi:ubiquinone biosynthesis protein UbiJ